MQQLRPHRRPNRTTLVSRNERGVTLLLVAVAMFTILAMAALAIDVVTLYVGRAEAQTAADAAAMAGAKSLVAGGVTADPNNNSGVWQVACLQATDQATAAAQQNPIGGVVAGTIIVTFPNAPNPTSCNGTNAVFGINPQVQVRVERNDFPTFFARIWRRGLNTVSATATAEAFNPSNSASASADGNTVGISPKCVKPWLIPNKDPADLTGATPLIDPTTGALLPNAIGERFLLRSDCRTGRPNCQGGNLNRNPPQPTGPQPPSPLNQLDYVPASVQSSPVSHLPSCAGGSDFEQAIEGCDTTTYSCGLAAPPAPVPTADLTLNRGTINTNVREGVQCLIMNGNNNGPDTLASTTPPWRFQVGPSNPLAGVNGIVTNDELTSSNSVVTVPVYDGAVLPNTPSPQVNIVGFVQLFINDLSPAGTGSTGRVDVTILNISGCVRNPGTTAPVSGGGISAVPVRLMKPSN